MYIYNFLSSLSLLCKPNVPKLLELEQAKYICYGTVYKKDLPSDILEKPDSGEAYFVYAPFTSPLSLKYYCIDSCLNYINNLNTFQVDVAVLSDEQLFAGIFEAVWLFEEISSLPRQYYFDVDFPSILVISGLYTDNVYEPGLSVVSLYDGDNITLETIEAQFRYFVTQYLKTRFNLSYSEKVNDRYYEKLKDVVTYIKLNSLVDNYKVEPITGIPNLEFDYFIQQIKDWIELQPSGTQ